MWWLGIASALAWDLLGPEGQPTERTLPASALFAPVTPDWGGQAISVDPEALAAVARDALRYIRARRLADPLAVQPGMLAELGVTMRDVEDTLAYIAQVAETEPDRLSEPDFWSREFTLYAWRSDQEGARERGMSLAADRIRVTRYLVYQISGSPERTEVHRHALYAVPRDEAGLSLEDADARAEELTRFQHTRAEVLGGVFEPGGAAEGASEPLVWLSREGVYESLMQGTVEVQLPDGQRRMFNVDRPNGMAYDPSIRSPGQQARYWYFAEVDAVMGWGAERAHKVRLAPGAAVAGDVYNLGLGKLVALERHGTLRFAVLADTGGAFQPNLFQLDLFTGAFPSRAAFQEATWQSGGPSRVVILVRKRRFAPDPEGAQPAP